MRTKNITVAIPDDVYRAARVFAARRDTSISALVKYVLENLTKLPAAIRAINAAEQAAARAAAAGPGAETQSAN